MGDPAGIVPEICLQALTHTEVLRNCVPIIIGDAAILNRCSLETGIEPPRRILSIDDWGIEQNDLKEAAVLDLNFADTDTLKPGRINADSGKAAYAYIEKAIALALAGEVGGVTTAPINKEALRMAGVRFPGHTEIFAAKTKAGRACMMLTSPVLTCSFVTVHVGYHEVPALLSTDRILDVIELTHQAMRLIRETEHPKLAVCGLNPHAGEHGLFGNSEEEAFIIPAIERAAEKGISIEGPLPPDTAFLPSRREKTDAFICMYHDQGHIPLKALAFDEAINTTLGLSIIRTSVDHGTALDIAWRGIANPNSLFEAILLAAKLTRR